MNKIKVIWNYTPSQLQDNLDKWIKKESPNIINSSIAVGDNYAAISVVYNENKKSTEPDINHLLRS